MANIGVDLANIGVDMANIGVDMANLGVDLANIGVNMANMETWIWIIYNYTLTLSTHDWLSTKLLLNGHRILESELSVKMYYKYYLSYNI